MKQIIISDTHLGQTGEDGYGQISLLSKVPNKITRLAEQKLTAFSDVVSKFANGNPVELVVNGDLLDLSLSPMKNCLESLVHMLSALPDVSSLVIIVGNHDHHLWMMHKEFTNSLAPMLEGQYPTPGGLFTPSVGEACYPLEHLLESKLGRVIDIYLEYPDQISGLQDSTLMITHGHLFGKLYTLVSDLMRDFIQQTNMDSLAVSNLALVEFIYWLMGETGERLGADGIMEAVYVDMEQGKSEKLKKIMRAAVDTLLPDGAISWIPDSWERALVRWMAKKAAENIAKKRNHSDTKPHSNDRHEPSEKTRAKAKKWISGLINPTNKRVVVATGHTHIADEWEIPELNAKLYNTGSWLMEAAHPNPHNRALLVENTGTEFKEQFVKV